MHVVIDGELIELNALVMTLSYSRDTAVIWSYKKDKLSGSGATIKSLSF